MAFNNVFHGKNLDEHQERGRGSPRKRRRGCAPNKGVLDDAVVTGRDHDHGLRAHDDLLMLLAREGERADEDLAHVGVRVQDMDVLEGLDANHLVIRHSCYLGIERSVGRVAWAGRGEVFGVGGRLVLG